MRNDICREVGMVVSIATDTAARLAAKGANPVGVAVTSATIGESTGQLARQACESLTEKVNDAVERNRNAQRASSILRDDQVRDSLSRIPGGGIGTSIGQMPF